MINQRPNNAPQVSPRIVFLRLRPDPSVPGPAIPAFLFSTEVFWVKLDQALRQVLGSRYKDEVFQENVSDRARRAIAKRLAKTRGWEFIDQSENENQADDEFRAWLFGLCKVYADFACKKVLALKQPPIIQGSQEMLTDLPSHLSSGTPLPSTVYTSVWNLVLSTIASFSDPLRGVLEDELAELSVQQSAEGQGISKNWVSQLRGKGRAFLQDCIREALAGYLP